MKVVVKNPVRGEMECDPPTSRDAACVLLRGTCPCERREDVEVAGRGPVTMDSHTATSTAVCMACRQEIGELVTQLGTVFGVDVDQRTLAGPWKIF